MRYIIIILLLTQMSCISKKKYGLFFSQTPTKRYEYKSDHADSIQLTEDSLVLIKLHQFLESDSGKLLSESQNIRTLNNASLKQLLIKPSLLEEYNSDLPIPKATIRERHEYQDKINFRTEPRSYRKLDPFGVISIFVPILLIPLAPLYLIEVIVVAVLGLTLAEIGLIRTKQKRGTSKGRGFAIAGAILNAAILIGSIIFGYFFLIAAGLG